MTLNSKVAVAISKNQQCGELKNPKQTMNGVDDN
jgi:hypothetical protein